MPVIKLCRGIQGIGKSTYARHIRETQNYVRVSKDELRLMESSSYDSSNPTLVDDTMHGFIQSAINLELNVIVDNTFCFTKHIDDIIYKYHAYANIEIVSFPNDIERAIVQNSFRSGGAFIDPTIIQSFSKAYNQSTTVLEGRGYEKDTEYYNGMGLLVYKIPKKIPTEYTGNNVMIPAVVFDIDNTLAIKGRRQTYDFAKCELDIPIVSTKLVLKALNNLHLKILFVTGRSDNYRTETSNWINNNLGVNANEFNLFMKPASESKMRDSVAKEKIYVNHLQDKYNIVAWFEDSQKVIKEFLIPYKIPFFDTTYSHHL